MRLRAYITHTPDELGNAFPPDCVEALGRLADLVHNRQRDTQSGAELAKAAEGCQIIIAHRSVPGLASTFEIAPQLVAFMRSAVDVSTIDIDAASKHGILVTRAAAGFSDAVAELGVALMLDLARGISRYSRAQSISAMPIRLGLQLRGRTLGIVGFGRIGRRLAEIALALGMRVVAYDPHPVETTPSVEKLDLPGVLDISDFVVCLAAANTETAGLFGAAQFAAMKESAYFINLSRGILVDEDALANALDTHEIAGAALDVGLGADQRPTMRFHNRDNAVVTPHIGGVTAEARRYQAEDVVEQMARLVRGEIPQGAINGPFATRLIRLAETVERPPEL
ncbi:hydroxyacid dehydrogenase [Rhizobium sp. P32RR-XVIII]|uniref:NAD(P)-dependent oxidoreductase n=1 Tax=Rhizobium sp. P32RR-XVIII TaxID=2726738 RepID=UPI001456E78F|nr:NAD(P)-dependent oxidoreductase [Rhizobium sp. P32RR-XVIII]NLS06859.1 hydroxyacid dehydrogenase [Rhizobium sp. P32RR-XVIII]